MQSMRHGVPFSLESRRASPPTSCIGSFALGFKIEKIFYESSSHFEKSSPSQSPKSCTQKREEATRQQGGLFFRENSSNGGKAIRTFWRNTKFGKIPCQG